MRLSDDELSCLWPLVSFQGGDGDPDRAARGVRRAVQREDRRVRTTAVMVVSGGGVGGEDIGARLGGREGAGVARPAVLIPPLENNQNCVMWFS